MKPTEKQKAAARESVRQYEASMAIEGLHLDDEGRALIEHAIEHGLSHKESQALITQNLKDRGLIPTDDEKITLAAE